MINYMLPSLFLELVIVHHVPMKVLKQKNILEKFIINAEAHLDSRQISAMEPFDLTVFAKKVHHRFSFGF